MPEKIITHPQNNVYAREWERIFEPERGCETCKNWIQEPDIHACSFNRFNDGYYCGKLHTHLKSTTETGSITFKNICNTDNGFPFWEKAGSKARQQ